MFLTNLFVVNAKSFVVVQARIIKKERKMIKDPKPRENKTYILGTFVPIESFCFSSKAIEKHKDYSFRNLHNTTVTS